MKSVAYWEEIASQLDLAMSGLHDCLEQLKKEPNSGEHYDLIMRMRHCIYLWERKMDIKANWSN